MTPHPLPAHGARGPETRLARVYLIESLGSVASSLLGVGIYFYTTNRFGWSLRDNFTFSAAQGLVYTFGALIAHRVTARFGSRVPLVAVFSASALLTLLTALLPTPIVIVPALLAFTFITTICWPILENLITAGDVSPQRMSHRIAVYNVIWAGVGGMMVAASGEIIEYWPRGLFILSCAACALAVAIALAGRLEPGVASEDRQHLPPPEPQLERQRVLALWLSRICIPSMYVVSYALAAMLPSLSIMSSFRPSMQTLLGSVWMIARWICFLILGFTSFWHTRPRLLLGAAVLMLVSIFAITLRPTQLLAGVGSEQIDIASLILGQIALGTAAGMIFTGSLYFGMVLSEGSTEHGGYHEALIGLGMILGPSAGVLTQWVFPGDVRWSVAAVAGLAGVSTAIAFAVAAVLRQTSARADPRASQ